MHGLWCAGPKSKFIRQVCCLCTLGTEAGNFLLVLAAGFPVLLLLLLISYITSLYTSHGFCPTVNPSYASVPTPNFLLPCSRKYVLNESLRAAFHVIALPKAKGNKSPKSCAFCRASPHWGVLGSNLPAVLHRFNTYHLLVFVTTPTVMMHNCITSQWSFKFSLYIDHAEFTYQITPSKKKQKTVLKKNSNKNLSFHSALLPSSSLNAFHYYFPSCKQVSSITTKWSF